MSCRRPSATAVTGWLVALLALPAGPSRADEVPATGPAAEPRLTDAELMARAVKVGRQTGLLRGLRLRRKVPMGFLTREAVIKRIEQKMAREYTDEEIQQEADLLRVLGLLPQKLDYRRAILDLLKDQVAGFYDPDGRTLNLARWIPFSLQEPALAHELCHALQDQHFGLKSFSRPIKDNSDRQLARTALVEGDCTGVMLEYMLRDQGIDLGQVPTAALDQVRASLVNSGAGVFTAAPRFMRETLLFPYVHGLGFMQELRTRHPWSVVNRMFKAPPRAPSRSCTTASTGTASAPSRSAARR